MLEPYNVLKFVHVLLAIVAVGFNASYGIWLARAAREPQHLSHVLRGIKTLDDRFANPAYVLLLVTGLVTAFVGRIPLETFWIAASIGLWVVLVAGGLMVYTPTLRRQIALVESGASDTPEYARLARRGQIAGVILAVIVVAIVFLMVTKPTLAAGI
ncbi:MAG: DUF2269 domain-containing protein [Chloroflexota bacterium]|nr:DUF2269 domain-containing protein [Chloroflexota bacterium]